MDNLNQTILERKIGFAEEQVLDDAQSAINRSLLRLDLLAHRMEIRWGVGRLQDLASSLLRERWDKQRARLEAAVLAGDAQLVADLVESSIRGWAALEREAEAAGHVTYQPEYWDIKVNDKVFIVVRDNSDVPCLDKKGLDGVLVTLGELVRVYEARHAKTFPDPSQAFSEGLKLDETKSLDDEIPF